MHGSHSQETGESMVVKENGIEKQDHGQVQKAVLERTDALNKQEHPGTVGEELDKVIMRRDSLFCVGSVTEVLLDMSALVDTMKVVRHHGSYGVLVKAVDCVGGHN